MRLGEDVWSPTHSHFLLKTENQQGNVTTDLDTYSCFVPLMMAITTYDNSQRDKKIQQQ